MEFSHSEHNSNRGNFEIKGVSLLSKICSYFWNSKNRKYFKTAGILLQGSFKFLPETVCRQGAESDGGSFIQTPPHAFPIFGIPEIWTILKPRECQAEGVSNLSVKLSVLKELSHFQGELQTEKSPRLSNSKNLDYSKIAGILIWKSFTFFQNFTLIFGIPEIGNILEPREFYSKGVSNLSLKLSVL